jgi:aconitate hydratase
MVGNGNNSFGAFSELQVSGRRYGYFRIEELKKSGWTKIGRFPVSIKVLLENLLRNEDGKTVTARDIETFLSYPLESGEVREVPFMPGRVLLQDFTGVPAVVDLSAMRDAMLQQGGDPARINPLIRADLVIDHSVQVDAYGASSALDYNIQKEYERNRERYSLLRWAQGSFNDFSVVPPGTGIVHQVNIEYLAPVVQTAFIGSRQLAYSDTVVGTDSHTTMVNALGVLGWGVGGIEAEAVMLGQPYYLPVPEVVGVKLLGETAPGITSADIVLEVTQKLRAKGVVGKFVEFFGPGLASLTVPDRATIANMSPEYGATVGFFPIDDKTLDYLRLTGRPESLVELVEAYAKEQGLFANPTQEDTLFSDVLEIDLAKIETNLAGPKRPQDRVPLSLAAADFREVLRKPVSRAGFEVPEEKTGKEITVQMDGVKSSIGHGAVVIAAITSCTNTSNPASMIAAGLLARKALELGIRSKPWVKTSLAPGSRVVTDYLEQSGLLPALEGQGFYLAGYGCTTCIGNSGPLPEPVQQAIDEGKLVAAAVLSGNRNFEGRIHQSVRANYLASPPLVVAYALAGSMTFDFEKEPLGRDKAGKDVFLRDLWPRNEEISRILNAQLHRELFVERYKEVFTGDAAWQTLPIPEGGTYSWSPSSTYIRKPPFFDNLSLQPPEIRDIPDARVLLLLGDSVTTDHISPAGAIPKESPAGRYLLSAGVAPEDFNSYGSRRGNHEVMIRGTFANVRIRNQIVEGVTGGFTRHFPDGEQMTVWEASERYHKENVPLIVIAGKEYGSGSSRDWAAKGTVLLGVKAVIAESFERIHRSNLIGMGVLPLQFSAGYSAASLGLTGEEVYTIRGISNNLKPAQEITVEAVAADGKIFSFSVKSRLDTPVEVEYYRQGGILPKVLRDLLAAG